MEEEIFDLSMDAEVMDLEDWDEIATWWDHIVPSDDDFGPSEDDRADRQAARNDLRSWLGAL